MYLMQCLTASNASFLTSSATNQPSQSSSSKSFRDSPRASVSLLAPRTSPSAPPTRKFAVSAKLPKTGILWSATYNLTPVDATNEQLPVIDLLGAGVDVGGGHLGRGDLGGGDLAGGDAAPTNPATVDLQNSEVTHYLNLLQAKGSPIISYRPSPLSTVPSATPSSTSRRNWTGT